MFRSPMLVSAALFGLAAAVSARGDVGVVQINKSNQAQRAGNRFSIGVGFPERADDLARVEIYVKKQDVERFMGASLTLLKSGKWIASIPVKMTPHKNGSGYSVALWLSRDPLRECHLDLGFDQTKAGSPHVATDFRVEIASYAETTEKPPFRK